MIAATATFSTQVNAQTIQDANNLSTPGTVRACSNCGTLIDEVYVLNADMIQLEARNGNSYYEKNLYAVAAEFDGRDIANTTPIPGLCGFWVADNYLGSTNGFDLPSAGSGAASSNYTASDPDVAVGTYYTLGGTMRYFVYVIYVAGGNVFGEIWDYDPSSGTLGFVPGATSVLDFQLTTGMDARNPRIDYIPDRNFPNDLNFDNREMVITFENYNSGTATMEVYFAKIDLFGGMLWHEYVDDGHSPDVAYVANPDHGNFVSPVDYTDDLIYITYINSAGDLMLKEYTDLGGSIGPNFTETLTSASNGVYASEPRIAGPVFYFYSANPSEPACVVTATIEDNNYHASTNRMIRSYSVIDPAGTSPLNVQPSEISDYASSGTGPFFNYDCINPMITGVGEHVSGLYGSAGTGTPNREYAIQYYSELTNINTNNSANTNGDFYVTDVDPMFYTPVLDWYEVCWNDLSSGSSAGDNYNAIATSNNTGYKLLSAFYNGDRIDYRMVDHKFQFKPTSINSIANAEVAVYPNPVTTEVTIGDANGAAYTITDITGKVLANGTLSSNAHKISTANYAAGTYILQVIKDGVPSSVKFVKQ